jgi:uncharacterized protein YfeS
MSDVFSLFEEEAANPEAFNKVSEGETSKLSNLIRQSIDLTKQVNDAEQHLKDLQHRKRTVDEEDIPSLMEQLGVESLTVDGNKVTIDKFVSARIPDDRKDEAFNFIRSIGEGDIIKNEIVVGFSMGQDNVAGAVVDDLRKQGLAPAQKTHIHPMTLRTWAKNRIDNSKTIDFDLFGIYVGNRAKIKGAK